MPPAERIRILRSRIGLRAAAAALGISVEDVQRNIADPTADPGLLLGEHIDLGEYTFNLADITPTGEAPNRNWDVRADPIDLGPGAHVAEMYAEVTAFNLDGGSVPAPIDNGTGVVIGIVSLPTPTEDPWRPSSGTVPSFTFPSTPTLPRSIIVGTAILSRYAQVQCTILEHSAGTPPGAAATITFNMNLLVTTTSTTAT